jgi:hypothetical protein
VQERQSRREDARHVHIKITLRPCVSIPQSTAGPACYGALRPLD